MNTMYCLTTVASGRHTTLPTSCAVISYSAVVVAGAGAGAVSVRTHVFLVFPPCYRGTLLVQHLYLLNEHIPGMCDTS